MGFSAFQSIGGRMWWRRSNLFMYVVVWEHGIICYLIEIKAKSVQNLNQSNFMYVMFGSSLRYVLIALLFQQEVSNCIFHLSELVVFECISFLMNQVPRYSLLQPNYPIFLGYNTLWVYFFPTENGFMEFNSFSL